MSTLMTLPARHSSIALLMCCSVFLLSCESSSSSIGGENTSSAFSAAANEESLRSSLLTEVSSASATEYWECTPSGGSALLSYQFLDDGSGVETELTNQGAQSSFTWQVVTTTSITTTVNATGAQNTFTDIGFTDSDTMTLKAAQNLTMTCQRRYGPFVTPDDSPRNNALSYGGVSYDLTHGFEESSSLRPDEDDDTHSSSVFTVANAEYKLATIVSSSTNVWLPIGATVWLRTTLHSPGADRFISSTFSYESDSTANNDSSLADSSFFNHSSFGVDINEDGSITSDDGEFIDVTGGTITVERLSGNDARMEFNLLLANGVTLAGSFEGLFVLYKNNN